MSRWDRKTVYEALGRDPVHPFPARMAPEIALVVLAEAKRPVRVLDPMMGSGTVLALARSKGHWAIGLDIDPLATLIARVWTTAIHPDEVRCTGAQVLRRARSIFAALSAGDAYPRHADIETRRFVASWFDECARRQLASLAIAIERVRDKGTRDALWCAFSRLIIAKQSGASLAMDLPHSRPHKVFDLAPAKPFGKFVAAVDRVIQNCIDKRHAGRGPATRTYEGDARDLPLDDASIDLVLTSPPYLNAIDYLRCSKFSLVWMGHSIGALRRIRAASVGSEVGKSVGQGDQMTGRIMARLHLRPALATREESVLARYVDDMRRALGEVARVLTPGGRALYVVGENMIRGTYIPNAAIVTMAASASGLRLCDRRTRTIPSDRRYLPPPSATNRSGQLNGRVRREVVLSFRKPVGRRSSGGPWTA